MSSSHQQHMRTRKGHFFPPDLSCSNGGYHYPRLEQLVPEVCPVSDMFSGVPFSAQSRNNGRPECVCKTNHNSTL